jgi:hypothetical protein
MDSCIRRNDRARDGAWIPAFAGMTGTTETEQQRQSIDSCIRRNDRNNRNRAWIPAYAGMTEQQRQSMDSCIRRNDRARDRATETEKIYVLK